MSSKDPKVAAQEKFVAPQVEVIDLIRRLASDPPIITRGLLNAVGERAANGGLLAELGFGSGWLLEAMRDELPDTSLIGVDFSTQSATRANELYGDKVRVLLGDMEKLPFRDDSLDVIVTCWTLYFMRDIDAALLEIRRCLKPMGRLVAATSAPDHEFEFNQIVSEATRTTLGSKWNEPDIGRRFDLQTGAEYVRRHFPKVEVREWEGELVVSKLDDMLGLWPKWQPVGLSARQAVRVRRTFEGLVAARLKSEGSLRTRRHDGAFVCDLN